MKNNMHTKKCLKSIIKTFLILKGRPASISEIKDFINKYDWGLNNHHGFSSTELARILTPHRDEKLLANLDKTKKGTTYMYSYPKERK